MEQTKNNSFISLLEKYNLLKSLPMNELLQLFSENRTHYVFIKDHEASFQWANDNFIKLMGLSKNDAILGLKDKALCADKTCVKKYIDDNEAVFDTGKPLIVTEKVMPKLNSPLKCTMQGKIHPLLDQNGKTVLAMGIVTMQTKIKNIDLDTILSLTSTQIKTLLVKRSYPVSVHGLKTSISSRQAQCLLMLIQGSQAGDIAEELNLQQTTVESYINTLKCKLGVNSRRELIDTTIKSNLLSYIFYDI